ncbi:hypothetical protein BV22DRAFT_1135968 [Leucogyrophana mollusca]|uniref:Uncharacterized protein n=1 Tax=Leucogyrophana mollusca TaxID=85980 RepID=A0ACB8ATZ4_9AGAM|nr:hypothetical protein BV22DRAFT_1135968 [Leucogyrophana mollusca]
MSAANTPVPATTPVDSTSNSGVPENPITLSDEGEESVEELEAKLAKKKQERAEKKRREEERKKREAEEAERKKEQERRQAEEAERQRKEAEAEKVRAEAEAAKQRQAGAASASVGGSIAGSTRSAGKGKGKGKAMEGADETPEGTEGGAETEVSVRLAVKCQECTARKRDCKAVFKGDKPMACDACRKSKAKCSLLPDSERKRERAGTVASPRGGEKRKKSKIAETEKDWDSEGEHRDNRDALGALSQSMMGLTDEVREFRMDFRRGLRLLDRVAFALETLAQVETGSQHEYPTDDEAEGPVASGSGRK